MQSIAFQVSRALQKADNAAKVITMHRETTPVLLDRLGKRMARNPGRWKAGKDEQAFIAASAIELTCDKEGGDVAFNNEVEIELG